MTAAVLPFTGTEPQLDETVLRHDLNFILRHLGPTTLIAIMPDSGQITGHYTETADDAAVRWIIRWNGLGRNIYFHLNKPRAGITKKAAKTDIVSYYATCADIDAKNGRTLYACRTAITRLPLEAAFITETGGGYQPIWLLAEPLPASPENLRRVEAVGEAVAALTGGDKVGNVDRILRMPATVNHPNLSKRDAGRVCCMARLHDPPDPLPRYTLEQLEAAFLMAAATMPGAAPITPGNGNGRPGGAASTTNLGPRPAHITDGNPHLNAAAQAGMRRFANLPSEKQNAMLAAMLEMPAIKALADVPRDQGWRDILFALADAERLGATEARPKALDWSMRSPRFNEADFHRTWTSFDPNREKPTTISTLLGLASDAGFDIHSWLDGNETTRTTTEEQPAGPEQPETPRPVGTNTNGTSGANPGTGNGTGTNTGTNSNTTTSFFAPVPFDAADLHPVPWLVSTFLIRGDITMLVGQGGSAKTALMIAIAVVMACGRSGIGPFMVRTREGGLRVALMSAEEDPNRLGLLVAAACATMALSAAERALVRKNLWVHDARQSGWRLGEARTTREEIAPEQGDAALASLNAALAQQLPDVIMMDTFATLLALPSEIENSLVTRLMNRLARAARNAGCAVLLLHHTPKLTRAAAAEQRGEATLVRGGSAITNSARVVYTITPLPDAECALLALNGIPPNSVRRLEPAKINDAPMAPETYVQTVSAQVAVRDGTDHTVRAVQFVQLPQATAAGIPDAHLNLAMKTIDAGARDQYGAKVPLSPSVGGNNNRRDPVEHIAAALRHFNAALSAVHAKTAAKALLKQLLGIGCIAEREVSIPRYKDNGQPNGSRLNRGLVTDWSRAPWVAAAGTGTGDPRPEDGANATTTCAPAKPSTAPATRRRTARRSPADQATGPDVQPDQA